MIDLKELFVASLTNTISGLITNIFYIILFIWGIKTLVKQIPKWMEQYQKMRERQLKIEWAKGIRR